MNLFKRGTVLLLLAGVCATTGFAQVTKRIYLIGNSVTDAINYDGFETMALSRGNTHIWGRSMTPGAPLEYLWHNAPSFSKDPFGPHTNALPNYTWDAITLQPFDRSIFGTNGDLAMANNFINEAKTKSPGVQFYIYSRWPRTPNSKAPNDASLTADVWEQCWQGTYSNSQPTETRQFFIDLVDTLRGANTDVNPICIIPVGDVFSALNEKMKNGNLSGLTKIWDVYSDGIHLNGIGAFIAATTFYATIYKQDPRGIPVPLQYGAINPAIADSIQKTVYEVVFFHPLSGASTDDLIPVSSVRLDSSQLQLSVLNSFALGYTIEPSDAVNKNVTWISENTNIAIVNTNGKITGLSAGTTNIIIRTADGGYTDTCEVTITGTIPGTTQSGVIAAWDFAGMSNVDSVTATYILPGIISDHSSCKITIGGGITKAGYVGNGIYGSNQTTIDLPASLAANEYFSIKIQPEYGKLLSIDTIEMKMVNQNNPRYFTLMSSINGFNTNSIIDSVRVSSWLTTRTIEIENHTNLPGEVEFRSYIYGYNNAYESIGFGNQSGNDIVIKGSLFSPSDNEAPSTPQNLAASLVRTESLYLSWSESSDNLVVWGYNIYQDGSRINNELVQETTFGVTGLTLGTSYSFHVTAVDFLGNESDPAVLNVMTNRRPIADISTDKLTGEAPLTVQFNSNESSDPDSEDFILGFNWDFGDGSAIDYSNSPQHTFESPGTYTISLRVMDNRELYSEPVTQEIVVTEPAPITSTQPSTSESGLVYPNPATTIVYLRPDVAATNPVIKVHSIAGKTVWTGKPTEGCLHIETLEKGLYVIEIKTHEGVYHQRLRKF